jgi:AraC-like DNA-binding protein
MTKPTNSTILPDRLRELTAELCRHVPESTNRLARANTEREFLKAICELFNLATVLTPEYHSLVRPSGLSKQIREFISSNLHKGLTLKLLAEFLGYSEKYCSELFQSTMGESFSGYLKRQRTETASLLLTTTDKSVAEIAAALGFSDPFSFSHFFKRSTGLSPREFRTDRGQRRSKQTSIPSSYQVNR